MTLHEDYRVIRDGAAMAELMPRGLIAVSGRDRRSYLQGLLTNDIEALQPGTGCYAAWLTPQGRMTTDLHVLESGDMLLLDVPAAVTSDVLRRLEQFIFSEDVQVGDLSDRLIGVGVHGPRAATVLEQALQIASSLDQWPQYRNARVAFGEMSIVVARIDQLGVPGFVVYVDRPSEAGFRLALQAAGAQGVSADAVTAARIEAGYPLYGIDMTDDVIPLEAGIESRAISFSKGCYVGQEVVIRVLHRGHGRVVRKLVGLRLEGDDAGAGSAASGVSVAGGAGAPPGTRLHVDGRDVGFVTSSAVSPERGCIALAYVHRDFIEPGARVGVCVGVGAGSDPTASPTATVTSLPFPTGA